MCSGTTVWPKLTTVYDTDNVFTKVIGASIMANIINLSLDSISLDFDAPDLERITDKDELLKIKTYFFSVLDVYPNDPFLLPAVPADMPEHLQELYSYCYSTSATSRLGADTSNVPACFKSSIRQLDKETEQFVSENMYARIAVFDPKDLPLDLCQKLDLEQIYVHRSIIFVPLDQFNMETMGHLKVDVDRRIREIMDYLAGLED